jgi:UPF0755 protein
MKNDIILPPKLPRPINTEQTAPTTPAAPPAPAQAPVPPAADSTALPPVAPISQSDTPPTKRKSRRFSFKLLALLLISAVFVVLAAAVAWYATALRPVDSGDARRERVIVAPGSSLVTIGDMLEEKRLIRSRLAFSLYVRFTGAGARLQAGTYSLSPSESAAEIIRHFISGNVDQVSITFLPGTTLRRLQGESGKRTDIESALLDAGYEQEEIDAAFTKSYGHPLFADKPAGTDLEGYVFGETYKFGGSATVEKILEQTFDEYYRVIEKNNLIAGFKAQGLNLYQGITLASIIQREVTTPADQKQVAQIFLTRLKRGEMLGSDVTYQYAAKKAGVPPTPALDSPYNTRKVAGLPPGPISMPGESALQAVAAPASGDYVFFLSGDDDVTYFARTIGEHEANIRNYCQKKCSVF